MEEMRVGADHAWPPSCIVGGVVVVALFAVGAASVAFACPSCPTSRVVAAIVCGGDAWSNLAAILAPFPFFAALGALLHRLGRPASLDERRDS